MDYQTWRTIVLVRIIEHVLNTYNTCIVLVRIIEHVDQNPFTSKTVSTE